MEESMDNIDTVTTERVEHVEAEDYIKIKTEEEFCVRLGRRVKTEEENSMDLGETVPSVFCETELTLSADESDVNDIRAEEFLHTQEDEAERLAVALPAVKAADTNYMCCVESETGTCSETCVTCDVDGSEESSSKVEKAIHLKEEIPEAVIFPPINTEHEGDLNEQLHIHSAECRYSCDMHGRDLQHSCEVCNKAFSKRSYLLTHLRIHSSERPHACVVCTKTFSRKSTLKTHLRIHSGERPYACAVCTMAFSVRSNLKAHLRIHSGELPYICEVCNKAFREKSSLTKHRRIHSGERPYACAVCNKGFSQISNLINHQRVHSGEHPYACAVCKKGFNHVNSLKKHERIHSSEHP